jgi:hypothetical protein
MTQALYAHVNNKRKKNWIIVEEQDSHFWKIVQKKKKKRLLQKKLHLTTVFLNFLWTCNFQTQCIFACWTCTVHNFFPSDFREFYTCEFLFSNLYNIKLFFFLNWLASLSAMLTSNGEIIPLSCSWL